jgi:hypothetical protein
MPRYHRGHQWHRDDFAGVGQADQPLRTGARQPEARLFDLRAGLGRKPGRELHLERAEVDLGGASHGGPLTSQGR